MHREPDWHARRFIASQESAVLLDLPDIRQRDNYDCGNAAVAVVLARYRVKATVNLATAERGTGPDEIEQYFRRLGLRVIAGSMEIDDLRHMANTLRPVICLCTWPGDVDSHWVIVRGVSRNRVYYHCPQDGPESMTAEAWTAIWQATGRHGPLKQWAVCGWLPE